MTPHTAGTRARAYAHRPRVEELLEAANAGAKEVRPLFALFVTLGVYLLVTAWSVDQDHLIRGLDIRLPILGADLALGRFFAVSPIVFAVVHGWLVLHLAMVARTARELNRELRFAKDTEKMWWTLRLENLSLLHALSPTESSILKLAQQAITLISLGIFPLFVLINLQLAILPYHSVGIERVYRVLVTLVAVLLVLVWPALTTNCCTWKEVVRKKKQLRCMLFFAIFMMSIQVATLFAVRGHELFRLLSSVGLGDLSDTARAKFAGTTFACIGVVLFTLWLISLLAYNRFTRSVVRDAATPQYVLPATILNFAILGALLSNLVCVFPTAEDDGILYSQRTVQRFAPVLWRRSSSPMTQNELMQLSEALHAWSVRDLSFIHPRPSRILVVDGAILGSRLTSRNVSLAQLDELSALATLNASSTRPSLDLRDRNLDYARFRNTVFINVLVDRRTSFRKAHFDNTIFVGGNLGYAPGTKGSTYEGFSKATRSCAPIFADNAAADLTISRLDFANAHELLPKCSQLPQGLSNPTRTLHPL